MTENLQRALEEQKQQTEPYNQVLHGRLGIPLGGQRRVEVAGRNGYVYVQLRSNLSETIQAYNNQVSPSYGLPVLLKREGGKYIVLGIDTASYENNWTSQSPFLPRHANTHSFETETGGGGDIVWVYPRQFMPALVFPSGSSGAMNVIMSPYTLKNEDGTWKYVGNTGTAVFTPYLPSMTSGAVMGLVYLDSISGNPYLLINSGTVFQNSLTGSSQIYPYIPTVANPSTQIPLAAIRLVTGTSFLSWDNIYDVRQFIHTVPTGTGGGSASINTGTLNSLYLRLDASNDPVTHTLDITTAAEAAAYLTARSAVGMYIDQRYSGTATQFAPVIYADRIFDDNTANQFNEAAYFLADHSASGTYTKGIFHHKKDDITVAELNIYAPPTGVVLYADSQFPINQSGALLLLEKQGVQMFRVDGSGTAYSNNSPLIKEAPVNGSSYVRKNAGWEVASTSSGFPPGLIHGLNLSNSAGDLGNDITVSTGSCRDSLNSVDMVLPSVITKQIDAAWTVGTNQGGLDTGTVANGTYHVWLIKRSDTSVVDALFSSSPSTPVMPANYDSKRRIGSIMRATGSIRAFSQENDEFLLLTQINDLNSEASSATAALKTLSVPSGIVVDARFSLRADYTSQPTAVLVTSPATNDQAATTQIQTVTVTSSANNQTAAMTLRTNTASQIRLRSSNTGATIIITTWGWIDKRNRL